MKRYLSHIGAVRMMTIFIVTAFIVTIGTMVHLYIPVDRINFSNSVAAVDGSLVANPPVEEKVIFHLNTPEPLKAIYITACTASISRLRNPVVALFKDSEINAIIIDLKDYTGTISYGSTILQDKKDSHGCRISDLPEFLAELHMKGIYTIGRVTVFQDPFYASRHPDLAVKNKSDPSKPWRDKNGLAYIDVGAKPYWDYVVKIAKEGHAIGFDEINFDYVRFPSDGNLREALYSWDVGMTKSDAVRDFFAYLHSELASTSMITSADLFGLTTSASDDLGIGQKLENALPYFDYVAPMVYPSHFGTGYANVTKPATRPYDVIQSSMSQAVIKAIAASSSPSKLRPWLQAFDLGAVYTPEMVRAQIQATYDVGLTSWMLWNAGSQYKKEYFSHEGK